LSRELKSSDSEDSSNEESRSGKSQSSYEDRKSRKCAVKQNSKSLSKNKAKSHDHTDIQNESGSKIENRKTPNNIYIGNNSEEIMNRNNQENYDLSPDPDDRMVDIFNNEFANSVCDNTKEASKSTKIIDIFCVRTIPK
jgi:hypothetical protein